jgi:Tol biopolymer transport system component
MTDHDEFDRSLNERLRALEARVPGSVAPDLAIIGSGPVRERPARVWGALVAAGGIAAGLLLVFFLGGRLQPPSTQATATPQPTSSVIGSVAPSASVAPSLPRLSSLPGLIAFSRGGDVYTMRPDGTDVTPLTNDPMYLEYPVAWLADGTRLAYLRLPGPDGPAFHPNLVDSTLILVLPDGSGAVELGVVRPSTSFSPDGTKIAFDGTGHPDSDGIAVFDLVHGTLTRLTHDGGTAALWSPDGSRIAYMFSASGLSLEVGTVTLDGHAMAIAPDPAQDSPIRWVDVDGTLKLVFDSFRGPDAPTTFKHRAWVVNADGSGLQPLAESGLSPLLENNVLPSLRSPDGHWILSVCESADGRVCLAPSDGSEAPRVLESGPGVPADWFNATWSADSAFLVYSAGNEGDQATNINVLFLPDGEPIAITAPGSDDTRPVWQPVQK